MTQPQPRPTNEKSIADLVVKDIIKRKAIGIERYGTPLQASNGRDHLRDAYEEALNLACYLRAEIEKRRDSQR